MRTQVNIDSENAAFEGDNGRPEVARLLRQAADRIEAGDDIGRLHDINGNGCGRFDCEPGEVWRCDDCGQLSIEECEGQVCNDCGRGMISEGT